MNIRAEVVGQQFTELMEGLKWRREYAATFNAVIRDTWTGREKQRIEKARALSNRIQELERKTAELLDLLIDKTISPKDFEEHRDRIQCARDAAEAELDDCGFPLDDFDGLIAFAERMRDRLPMLWNRSNVAQKMQIQPAIFPDGIEVTQKGIGTAKYSLFFNSLDVARNGKPDLVAQICPRWNRLQPWFELVSRTPHSRPAQRFTLSLTSLLSAVLGEPTFASWNWLDGRLRQVEGLRRAA